MGRRHRFWNRAPRNRFEAWIMDLRDRFRFDLIAVAAAFLAVRFLGDDGRDASRPEDAARRRAESAVASGEELRRAAAASTGPFFAWASIPGLGDAVAIDVEFPNEFSRPVTDGQAMAFDRLLADFPGLRGEALDRMLAGYRVMKEEVESHLEEQKAAMDGTARALWQTFGDFSLPDIRDVRELEERLAFPHVVIGLAEKHGLAHAAVVWEADWTVNPVGVVVHGDAIVFAGEHPDYRLMDLSSDSPAGPE
ncbi:MAG: hypothetical protein LIP77_08965 [Planctomycetes bacterium]|nr:hypothetical protein [Planctomycetota bacterium]